MAKPTEDTVKPAPAAQAEKARRVTKTLVGLRDAVRDLGPVPPGADRDVLFTAINDFSAAVVETLLPPKKPRRRSRPRSSPMDDWFGI